MFSPAGKRKLDARIADTGSVLHKLGPCGADNVGPAGLGLMDEAKVHAAYTRALGLMWVTPATDRA